MYSCLKKPKLHTCYNNKKIKIIAFKHIVQSIPFSGVHLFRRFPPQPECRHLGLVVDSILGLALLLKSIDDWLVLPSGFVGQTSDLAVLTTGFQLEDSKGGRDHHSLLTIVRVRDAIKNLQLVERFHSSLSLVRDHPPHHLEETLAGSTEMVRTLRRFRVHPFPEVLQHLQLVPVEVS